MPKREMAPGILFGDSQRKVSQALGKLRSLRGVLAPHERSLVRQVLDCASPLALWFGAIGASRKRQRTGAVQDARARTQVQGKAEPHQLPKTLLHFQKHEFQISLARARLRISDFGLLSAFGFRLSDFCRPLLALTTFLSLAAVALAQPAAPRIGYVYPAGGRQGSTFQLVVGGQFLEGATNLFVSGGGVEATFVEFHRPMPQGKFNQLRDELRELQDRKQAGRRRNGADDSTNVWTAADEKRLTEIRDQILRDPPNRQATPAIADTVTLRVEVATNAQPGEREIRLTTPSGLSNPLRFCIGQLPEYAKPTARAPNPDLDRFLQRLGRAPVKPATNAESRVSLPATLNGQIGPGGVDRYRFSARKGQHLVAAARARALIPYLADAVPGWFQATLTLYDAKGAELGYNDDFRFHPDPVLHCEIPRDGEYVLEIKDAIYRGREDFVYRITVGELPFITSIFPLGGKVGETVKFEPQGWNLPVTKLTREPTEPGVQLLSVTRDEQVSNLVPFAVDTLSECFEKEAHATPSTAQQATLPIIVNGRIGQPGETDVFSFQGRAGEQVDAEVTARRLASPLDSVLKLTDANGQQLAFNDDTEDRASGLNTHHADSYLHATLPAAGTYFVHLGDTQRKGGPDYAYRLRLSAPRPDFELRAVPSSLSIRGGMSVPLTVYALRKDGFTNEIALALKDPPPGFALSGARIPAGQDQVKISLSAPLYPTDAPVSLSLEGRAVIQGRTVSHPAVPADDMMQAFAFHHLVPAQALEVSVSGRFMARRAMKILSDTPVKIPKGGAVTVRVAAPVGHFADRIKLELSDAPEGIALQNVTPGRDAVELVLQSDSATTKPGLKGNLIVDILAKPGAGPAARKGPAANRRVSLGSLPAIPFEIVER